MNEYNLISRVEITEKLPVYIQELDHEINLTINLIKTGKEAKAVVSFKNNMEALANLIELINVLCQVGVFEQNTVFFDFQNQLSLYLDKLIYAHDEGNLKKIGKILASETDDIFQKILNIHSGRITEIF
ncbi:MAG: hypothetical protein PF689_13625 [Deltaproteobacteria bacterium]|nr:hypothetical protein [Deltaproteobacteria bacterium]